MSRFFKSAAFPILIVVVLAFFISKVFVSPASKGPEHTYQTLVTEDIPNHKVKSAEMKVKDNAVSVELVNKEKYEVGLVRYAGSSAGVRTAQKPKSSSTSNPTRRASGRRC